MTFQDNCVCSFHDVRCGKTAERSQREHSFGARHCREALCLSKRRSVYGPVESCRLRHEKAQRLDLQKSRQPFSSKYPRP